jgi:putative membrane protein
LHPLTLLFATVNLLKGVAIPVIVLLFFGRDRFAGGLLLVFVAIPVAIALIRYFTFTYRLAGSELIITHGLLQKTERNIRLDRVQDIRLEQGLLHRAFGMTDVHVETAGGKGPEASLSVLSRAEAERLREAIFAHVPAIKSPGVTAENQTTVPRPAREIIRQLSVRELVLAGLTSNRAASAMALVLVVFGLLDDVMPKAQYERIFLSTIQRIEEWMSQAADLQWLVVLLGALALVLVGMVLSVIGSVVTFYGFTLSRQGEDLHRSYGLLTRRTSSLPRKRIQVLKVEETLLRRLFRLTALRADTAGSRMTDRPEDRGGRDVLMPLLPRAEINGILPVCFPDFAVENAPWRQVSRRAIRRATFKGGVVCLALAAVSWAIERHWLGLWPLLFIPTVYALSVLSYRHLGYALEEKYFRTRRGWFSRATHIVPIRNTQAIIIRQTPFDRRHGVATLSIDTAGQANTGGGPRINNVPWDEAVAVATALARRASDLRYRW